ncbi:MAG: nicotinamide-nucleotide amidohydrolase family protein [Zoogloeaceae bacterium]|nr:nicotinamide-nucleotide amidohydrolase family protein [Zoogloeaceae bacterium]
MDVELSTLSAETGALLQARGWMLSTAESCTGGWIAEVVTATAGSSNWFDCGFVSYSNESKQALLGVAPDTLREHGAVSEETVREMVSGALARSRAQLALAVSGIAGPGGAVPGKPVGTVCLAWGLRDRPAISETLCFAGDREAVRRQTVIHALRSLPRVMGAPD